ncbi:MAG: DUF6519 domain-containing protein [Thermoanaerobaculia bacterium]
MPGDYSRFSFDPRKRFSRLLMQQGKVQLDSDWNELVEILTRRDRVQANDVFGPAAVPRATTPTAFEITTAGTNDLAIGRGRMYVDGLLAEALESDTRKTYLSQPFFPDPPPLASFRNPQGLAYLDVWDREITAVDDESLLEPALGGVDTSTRTQTVWQVKIEPGDLDCATDLDDRFKPSSGRLTVRTTPEVPEKDPCQLPESGGLRDVENRFYRVEIHDVTPQPRFKFFRDPVATRIAGIEPVVSGETTLVVQRTGLDSVLRFSEDQWVEVTSDWLELNDKPGLMAKIVRVDHDDRKIRLDRAIVEADVYGPPVGPETAEERRKRFPARLVRWDQSGDDVDADGLRPVQLGVPVSLELGVEVEFSIATEGSGKFARGDYWYFPTRVAGRKAGPLEKAPPAGVLHHYAALAHLNELGTASPSALSCRFLWPPETSAGDCECAFCVTPESHNGGSGTIYEAVAKAIASGGGKVCLKPGVYRVDRTIELRGAVFVQLVGHGAAVLAYTGKEDDPVVHAEACIDSGIEAVIIARSGGTADVAGIGVRIRNCFLDFTVDDCEILLFGSDAFGEAIRLEGFVHAAHITRNSMLAARGVASALLRVTDQGEIPLNAVGLNIVDNVFFTPQTAVDVNGMSLLLNVEENTVAGANVGIRVTGTTFAPGSIVIDDNDVDASFRGIVFDTDATTISNNRISGRRPRDVRGRAVTVTVAVEQGDAPAAIFMQSARRAVAGAKILANRIGPHPGNGIYIGGGTHGAMIKENSIEGVAGGGIVVTKMAEALSIENNVVRKLTRAGTAGIAIAQGSVGDVSANAIEDIGPATPEDPPVYGVLANMPARLRISDNTLQRITGATDGVSAAIYVVPPFGSVEITGNNILFEPPAKGETPGMRSAILVGGVKERERAPRNDFSFSLGAFFRSPVETLAETAGTFFLALARLIGSEIDPKVLFAPLPLLLLIRANVLRATGRQFAPLLEVGVENARCTVGGNLAVVEQPARQDEDVVVIEAGSVVADSNQVMGGLGQGLTIRTGEGPWTLLGNIVGGGILVNGNQLSELNEPWKSGNRG